MRTTFDLSDELLEAAKAQALKQRTTLKQVVEDALRASLFQKAPPEDERPFELLTYGSSGLRPGVDIEHFAAIIESEDEDDMKGG